eukprot:10797797-Lingulodinium_polyedra.AAC.1
MDADVKADRCSRRGCGKVSEQRQQLRRQSTQAVGLCAGRLDVYTPAASWRACVRPAFGKPSLSCVCPFDVG